MTDVKLFNTTLRSVTFEQNTSYGNCPQECTEFSCGSIEAITTWDVTLLRPGRLDIEPIDPQPMPQEAVVGLGLRLGEAGCYRQVAALHSDATGQPISMTARKSGVGGTVPPHS